MGSTASSLSLTLFEIINEVYISVGAGVLGLGVLFSHGMAHCHFFRTVAVTAVTMGCLVYVFQGSDMDVPSKQKVVFITGCDSGLGFSLAQHACERGFTVFAGFLSLSSKGATELKRLFGDDIRRIELDITQADGIKAAVEAVDNCLKSDLTLDLWAVVNNAGVMVFGEFEWQTEKLVRQQLEVNLCGTMNLTKAFCPLLRKYKGRIITVTSHCAHAALPGLAVYGATKAGLAAWSDALRVELKKYGVKVITFIPGSFTQHSNIMSKQVENVYEMHSAFTGEQLYFYGEYFKRYNSYLALLTGPAMPRKIVDSGMYEIYERALLDEFPQAKYVNEPFRYTFYHTLFRITPFWLRDYLVCKFMKMPEYMPDTKISAQNIS